MTAAAESTPESTGPETESAEPTAAAASTGAAEAAEAPESVEPTEALEPAETGEASEGVESADVPEAPESDEAEPVAAVEPIEPVEPTEAVEDETVSVEPELVESEAAETEAVPAEPEPASVEPQAEPVEPEVAAAETGPVEAETEPIAPPAVPAEPKAVPAKPKAFPAKPKPVPAKPVPVETEHDEPAPAETETEQAEAGSAEPWGRVDDDGTVSVREADGWRVVGQFPDGPPEEALAYYGRKFADLASEVTLLEVRHRRGGASASDLRSAARAVSAKLDGAAAVGDLASLEARVAALTKTLAAASASEAAAAREAVDDAVRVRTELVERAEALAARDPRSVQWKQATAELNELFEQWQSQQQNGPRLPKSTAQQLWKRFRDARSIVDKHRREFYADLDEAHKGVRERKTKLVEKAESLASKGEDGIPAYRDLLDEWKSAGRAGKKVDDALWARFKAAGDALYSARIERETADAEASREKIEAKRALLEEAKAVADVREIAKARSLLTGIQRRWDDIGRIFPRDAERALDDDLRKIETALRTREDTDWKRNNPETKARANDMTRQLTDAIEKLEDELAAAKKSGDKKAIADATDALEARRSWLKALGG